MKIAPIVVIAFVSGVTLAACDRHEVRTAGPPDVAEGQKAQAQAQATVEAAGARIDDATVTAKVKAALIAEPGLNGLAIDVDTDANIVTLNGTVQHAGMRDEAERVAQRVQGVKQVRNNLAVKSSS